MTGQSAVTTTAAAPPLVPYIKTAPDGEHYLAGSRCGGCGEIFVGERTVCPRCCARDRMVGVRLAGTGTVYAFTIVERSFPGVVTPFVDVIVDLDDGAHLKATLGGVQPVPEAIMFDMPVRVVFEEVVPVNADGARHLSYSVVPAHRHDAGEPR